MHPDSVKYFVKLADLVDQGELPEAALPRLFYAGHKLVRMFYNPVDQFKCLRCKHVWEGGDGLTCPNCSTSDEDIYLINHNKSAKWECLKCKHTWVGVDGEVCPSCGAIYHECE